MRSVLIRKHVTLVGRDARELDQRLQTLRAAVHERRGHILGVDTRGAEVFTEQEAHVFYEVPLGHAG
jgi:hypothetical protein